MVLGASKYMQIDQIEVSEGPTLDVSHTSLQIISDAYSPPTRTASAIPIDLEHHEDAKIRKQEIQQEYPQYS